MSTISKTERLNQSYSFSSVKLAVGLILPLWFLSVFILGRREAFIRPAGSLPIPILMAIVIPILLFLIAFRISNRFREWVLTADLRLVTGIQAWRFAGFGFLALYTLKLLPGYFALPAGLGDIAIGSTAPFLVAVLHRNPGSSHSNSFMLWNVLGILDLVTAVTLAGLGRLLFFDTGGISTGVMARLPLSLIPTFFVPAFIILHLTALIQIRAREL